MMRLWCHQALFNIRGTLKMISDVVSEVEYDRQKEVKEFDETRAGVKGLVDSGVDKIPRMFFHPRENLPKTLLGATDDSLRVPVIDFAGYNSSRRYIIIEEIRQASGTWGFFQMVNHAIPIRVMDEMLHAVMGFHEQPKEEKMPLYSRDPKQPVRYYCNGDLLVSKAANWRDSIAFEFSEGQLDMGEVQVPAFLGDAVEEYMGFMTEWKGALCEMISEAIGLGPDYLQSLECMETASLVCHYYPTCPEPDLTLGATKHSDPSFLTILLQDTIGGLQVLHQNQWVDIPPLQGSLVANMGDFMQLITNDKFKSVEHRVLAGQVGSRVSVACFFYPNKANKSKPYEPITELLSDDSSPVYRPTHLNEYLGYYRCKGLDGTSCLPHFKF